MSSKNTSTTYLPGIPQEITGTGADHAGTALDTHTEVIRLFASVAGYFCMNAAPGSAQIGSIQLAAGVPEYINVPPSGGVPHWNAASGTLYITEMTH